jgi:hypothetical protein
VLGELAVGVDAEDIEGDQGVGAEAVVRAVQKRHDADRGIPEIPFAAPAGTPAGVEVLSLADLRHRVPAERLAAPSARTSTT